MTVEVSPPFVALDFADSVLRGGGMSRRNRFAARLNASRSPASSRRRLIDHTKFDPQRDCAIESFHFEEFRRASLSAGFALMDAHSAPHDWGPVLDLHDVCHYEYQSEMGLLHRSEMRLPDVKSPDRQLILQLFQAGGVQVRRCNPLRPRP